MKLKYLLLLFSTLLVNLVVNACSCRPRGGFTQKEFNDLGVIFTGQVVEDTTINRNLIKFKVIELFKGQAKNRFIYAWNAKSSCRIYLKKNDHYLVFLYGKADTLRNIDDCSRRIWIEDINSFRIPDWLTKCVNKPDGIDRSYYPNKKLASEGKLVNQQPEGFWKYYRKNGSLILTGYYKQGFKESVWTSYNFDGQIEAVTSYEQNERKRGKKIEYFDNGNIKLERYFEEGKKDYEFYRWKRGHLKQILTFMDKGEEMIVYAAKKNGKVMVKHGTGYYDMEGEPEYDIRRQKGACKDSLKVGIWRTEFKDSTLGETPYKHEPTDGIVEETMYKNGIKQGTFKRWTRNGKLRTEGGYQNGEVFGIWRFWYDSGKIASEVKWLEGEFWRVNSWTPDGHQILIDGNGKYIDYDYDGRRVTKHPEEYKNGKRKK